MIFSNNNNNINMHKSVTINNIILKKVGNIKFLGVIIDSKLTWSTHISSIKRKVGLSRGITMLCKARRLLKASTLITLYHSFFSIVYFFPINQQNIHDLYRHHDTYNSTIPLTFNIIQI